MKQAHRDTCRCWNCWAQDNFSSLALLSILVATMATTFYFVLTGGMEKKDAFTFLEGFLGGAFSSFTLALKGSPAEKPHIPVSEDSTVVALPPVQPDPEQPRPNLVEF